ncbi:AGE family epimerase/isomerase [Flavisolibacter ginsengisoli]|jgi:mannobiose 2-epimerase|nr:AGE family epimerase/isomerase [Flavisolibacter ginsengisoli]
MENILMEYSREMQDQLESILSYWKQNAPDITNGGFIGKIDHDNKPYPEAPKGSVLNSRILWAFSAAFQVTHNKEHLDIAKRAYDYIQTYFLDKEYGGIYWTVDYNGTPLDTKMQVYALAFAVYGMSELYKIWPDEALKQTAIGLYRDIVNHSYDSKYGGYIEALSRDWKELGDLRLSAKDANERKSMNTHLHVLEAFANLYTIWPDEKLKQQVEELIQLFLDHIISPDTHHLVLFFDDSWNKRSEVISYGHDIEAAWLVQEAAELVGNKSLLEEVKYQTILLTEAACEGLDDDGGLWYEYDPVNNHWIRQKHSWPQAEAMVGFLNAWQISGEDVYLQHSLKSWQFVKDHILDKKGGEWYWGVEKDYAPMTREDKVGIWKCPYHNSRACIEVIRRIASLK